MSSKNPPGAMAWAIIRPNGDVVLDSAFKTARDAWEVVLGWPAEDEIDAAKAEGYRVVFASVYF